MKLDQRARSQIAQLPAGVIVLSFGTVRKELLAFRDLCSNKLAPGATRIFEQLISDLEQIAGAAGVINWRTKSPIVTLNSAGSHQVERTGHGRFLRGEISFTWLVEPLGNRGPANRPLMRHFALRNSSVRTSLIDGANDIVSRWDFDLGDHRSPGCYFHAKYAEADNHRKLLYDDLDVPRLPTLLFMPTDAIEFVIGELWQDEWRLLANSSANEVNAWRRFPQQRLMKLFEWHLATLNTVTSGTPWARLKIAKPEPTRFI